jgi:predicted acyltransferase
MTREVTAPVTVPETSPVEPGRPAKQRLQSLDVFRGFTLLGMVLVNSHPTGIYPGLGHANWNGWGFADLIFPFFVFIVGVAVPYSFANRLARGENPRSLFWHVVRRCVILFAIGVFLNGYPRFDLSTLRVMNVLQRIAICYFLTALIYVYIRMSVRQIVWLCGSILVLYFVLMKFVPVPGYGAGVLEPVGNWGNYIDQHIMAGHMQHELHEGKSLLGSFPALVTMLMGLLTGLYLRKPVADYEKLTHLYVWGSASMAAGVVWSAWFPINQGLWTSSLVLFMGGVALLFLATCYFIVDVKKVTWWTTPFLIFGVNSIAVWILSQLGMKTMMAINVSAADGSAINLWKFCGESFDRYLGKMNGSLAFAIVFDLFWLGVLWVLYRRRIYIKF